MSQNWTEDVFATDHQGPTDLQNIENNLGCLKSMFSGGSAPSNAVAGMPWYHTSKGLRIRNAANSAWLKALQGDDNSKTWFYRNGTVEGWLVDSSVTDKVLAIKGGSAAYNVTGGNSNGSWTVSGINASYEAEHTHQVGAHGHKWFQASSHQTFNSSGALGAYLTELSADADDGGAADYAAPDSSGDLYTADRAAYASGAGSSHSHTVTQNGAWRPAAAVGTLQYPDLS